jgi:hypothetical protein
MYINTFQTKAIKTMNISRLIPFLPVLLLLLPATSGAAPMVPSTNQTRLSPSDLCPLVQIVEHELCDNASHNNFTDLCVLLHNYNTSFCSKDLAVHHAPLSNAVLSVRTLEHEFLNNKVKDIHKLCPILNFIDEELCTSLHHHPVDFQFYPKQLCPLLNITYEELCA